MFDFGFGPSSPWLRPRSPLENLPGFRVRPVDAEPQGVAGLAGWQPSTTPTAQPAPDSSPPATTATSSAWWEQPTGVDATSDEPHWPWLRAPADEVPGFRLNPDGSPRTEGQDNKVRLMEGALAPPERKEQLSHLAGIYGVASSAVAPPWSAGVPPFTPPATSPIPPASVGSAIDLAAIAARAASVLPTAGSAGLALPMLFVPTNTQSETTDFGDGLRARVRPGQRTVEIEQRVDDGLLGTGIGAKWKTLPVEAWQQVREDGRFDTVINHGQLRRALGLSQPAESKSAGGSAMAQPPKDGDPRPLPPPGVGSPANEADKPGEGNLPTTQSLESSRTDAKALEEARNRDPDEERLLACRAVRAMPGQPVPPGQYDGQGGIDTAVGIRVAPGYPAPKGGYDYAPDYLRHLNGYKGELELKNRIEKAVPYEKIIHYGNPAGVQGADVFSIGPQGMPMEWNSRSSQVPRRITRAGIPSIRYNNAMNQILEAIDSGAVSKDVGMTALQHLSQGNYGVCTVGTGKARDGYFVAVRDNIPSAPRR